MITKEYWLPTKVDDIINSFKFNSRPVLKKNLAYNIQYLQFLSRNIELEITTTTLYRMRYKTFVVISMSIIEAIFMALLEERNLIPIVEWKEGTHHKKIIDENTIEVSFKRKRIAPTKKKINFDEAIYLMEENMVLDLYEASYPVLRELQKLRNHLHLEKAQEPVNSDYNKFTDSIYKIMKLVLYNILNNDIVSTNKNYLEFLKLDND